MADTDLLKRAEVLCAKATPGPWNYRKFYWGDDHDPFFEVCHYRGEPHNASNEYDIFEEAKESDCEFTAQARTLVPELVALVRKYQADIESLKEHLELALSFCPKGPVPEGLAPTFYHTLVYEDEVKLQERIDKARAALAQGEGKDFNQRKEE